MVIALDGFPLTELLTGVGHYTFDLGRALALTSPNDSVSFVSPRPYVPFLNGPRELLELPNLHAIEATTGGLGRHWWTIGLPSYLRRHPVEIFHGTNYDVPLFGNFRTILTIHDLSLYLHPGTHRASSVRRARYRLPIMARRATMIVTPSNAVKRELCELIKVTPEKVVAVPHAARECFKPMPWAETIEVRKRLKIDDEFLLFVGTIEPRKNLVTLMRAFGEVLRWWNGRRPQLVIAGKEGWLIEELFDSVRQADLGDRVVWTGYLSDHDLCALYSSCRAFVYPSIYEGFGLPVLEAMACGAPVITSRVSSIVELVGNSARVVDPQQVEALSRSMIDLLESEGERKALATAGRQKAAEFSWESTAKQTRAVYVEALRRAQQ